MCEKCLERIKNMSSEHISMMNNVMPEYLALIDKISEVLPTSTFGLKVRDIIGGDELDIDELSEEDKKKIELFIKLVQRNNTAIYMAAFVMHMMSADNYEEQLVHQTIPHAFNEGALDGHSMDFFNKMKFN